MIGREDALKTLSGYQVSQEVANFTAKVRDDYQLGHDIQNRVYEEFNDMSMIERMNTDQRIFNNYIQPKSENISKRWRFNGIKPNTRNKIISMAAHFVSSMLVPYVFAQNEEQEEDKAATEVIRDMIEWNIANSDYSMSYLQSIIAALVNPAAFMKVEYLEAMQTIKEEDGTITEVVDDIISGINFSDIVCNEIFLTNAYEPNIQRQRAIGRKRIIDYDEAESLYKNDPNFKWVQPGVRIFLADDALFYEQEDEDLATFAEEFTYYNRREDTEVVYLNGIYLGDPNPGQNRMKHRSNKGTPKYPFGKFGFEPINHFAYYKSLVNKLSPDQVIIDTMWRMRIDATKMGTIPPIGITGSDKIDSNIMFPGSVHTFERPETTITPLTPNANFGAIDSALDRLEQGIDNASSDEIRQGVSTKGSRTAFEISRLEKNALLNLALFGAMVNDGVAQIGDLLTDLIVNHQTIAEVEEISGEKTMFKYRKYLIPEQVKDGKKITKKIKFTDKFLGRRLTETEGLEESRRIFEEEGGLKASKRILEVNPVLFSNLDFKVVKRPDEWLPENRRFNQMMQLEAYDRFINNPFVDQQKLTQKALEVFYKGEADDLMKEEDQLAQLTQQTAFAKPRMSMGELLNQNQVAEVPEKVI